LNKGLHAIFNGLLSMRVSLVVPLRNEVTTVSALIASIRCQTRQPDEVILVDGGSTDQTVVVARRLTCADSRYQVLIAGEATPGRGRNVGITAARYDWIALTDAGICLESTWLERLCDEIVRDPNLDVVFGNYEPVTASKFECYASLAYVAPKHTVLGGRTRAPSIASALLRRSAWQAVGGFPDLRAAEDLIFIERIQAAGYNVGRAPGATVWWKLQPSLRTTFRKFTLYSKHNVWASRQRYWHYGIARQYVIALAFLLLAALYSSWWLLVPVIGAVARVGKRIFAQRDGRGVIWLINPLQFLGVGLILATIDAATFIGWIQAAWLPRPETIPTPNVTVQSKCKVRSSE